MRFERIIKSLIILTVTFGKPSEGIQRQLGYVDICRLRLEPGTCEVAQRRFHFNDTHKKCIEFYYTGCGGNENNFENPEKCVEMCRATEITTLERSPADRPRVCGLQGKVPGPCTKGYSRFFYNKETNVCEEFLYGGCLGNDNNFVDVKDCRSLCGASAVKYLKEVEPERKATEAERICKEGKKEGPCRRLMPRFYFNNATGNCEEFIYGGCQGNDNNWVHGDRCAKYCNAKGVLYLAGSGGGAAPPGGALLVPIHPICLLPPDSGMPTTACPTMNAFFPAVTRFFFNPFASRCEGFSYTGCGGNSNNFYTPQDCLTFCAPISVPPNGQQPGQPLY